MALEHGSITSLKDIRRPYWYMGFSWVVGVAEHMKGKRYETIE